MSLDDFSQIFKTDITSNLYHLFKEGYTESLRDGYIKTNMGMQPSHANKLKISPKGKAYLENLQKEKQEQMINRVLAVAAILISIIALLKP